MKRLITLLMAGMVFSTALLRASQTPSDDLPHVRADGRHLMFGWHGGSPHRIDVSNLIRATTLDTARVFAAQRAGDVDYFVVSVSGPSQASDPGASTAGGTETNLLWLKLKSWKLLDAQSMLYQSYWDSIEPIGDYHLKSGVLTIRYSNKRENTDYVLRYDLTQPEGKITLLRAGDVE